MDQPFSMNSTASQSSSSGWLGGSPWMPKSSGVRTMLRPKSSAHQRLTVTRAVSGFSRATSQRASVSRLGGPSGKRLQNGRHAGLDRLPRVGVFAPVEHGRHPRRRHLDHHLRARRLRRGKLLLDPGLGLLHADHLGKLGEVEVAQDALLFGVPPVGRQLQHRPDPRREGLLGGAVALAGPAVGSTQAAPGPGFPIPAALGRPDRPEP